MAKKKSDDEVKNEILDAASTLLMKYGYNKTTMEDIAKAAGKGKSTLYYYYKSKEEIVVEVIGRESNALFSKVNKQMEIYTSAIDKIRAYYKVVANEVETLANFYGILKTELADNLFIQKKIVYYIDDKEIDFMKSLLRYGIERNEFKGVLIENVDALAVVMNDTTSKLLISYVTDSGSPKNWKDLFLLITDVLVRGII